MTSCLKDARAAVVGKVPNPIHRKNEWLNLDRPESLYNGLRQGLIGIADIVEVEGEM